MTAAVLPLPMPALETPRVRLIHGLVTCPRCAKKLYHLRIRHGESWIPCNHERLDRRGACTARWLNLTLPAGSLGADLTRLVGESAALTLMRLAFPHLAEASEAQCALIALASGTTEDRGAPSHFQIVVRGRDEHHLRWAPVAEVLETLGLGR